MTNIEITVRRPAKKGKRRRGPISSTNKKKIFARRRQQGSGIYFYDLGRFANDAPVSASYIVDWDGSVNPPVPNRNVLIPTHNALRDQVVSHPLSAFKPLLKDSKVTNTLIVFEIDAEFEGRPEDISQYTGNFLDFDSSRIGITADITQITGFFPIDLGISADQVSGYKVTSEPEFDADEVSFAFSGRMSIGLMPALAWQEGYVNYFNGVNNTEEFLNHFHGVVTRSEGIDNNLGTTYEQYYQAWNLMKLSSDARASSIVAAGPRDPLSVGDFPFSTVFPAPPGTPGPDMNSMNAELLGNPTNTPAGALLFIIEKGSARYYVWYNG